MIPAHCPRILFFLGFGQNAAKLGVCKNPTLTGSLSVFYMDRTYSDYINIIDEVEKVEQVIRTDDKITKCCYYSLELIKLGTQHIKNKIVNINIKGKRKILKAKEDQCQILKHGKKQQKVLNQWAEVNL